MSRHVSSRSVVHVHVGEGLVLPIHIRIAHAHLAVFRARSGALFQRLLDSVRAGMRDMVDSITTDGAASSSDASSKRALAKQSINLRSGVSRLRLFPSIFIAATMLVSFINLRRLSLQMPTWPSRIHSSKKIPTIY
jgi:hypothetical protein